jgi:PAS domain S-box-containing protein
MTQNSERKDDPSELRRRAESAFTEQARNAGDVSALSPEDFKDLLHELQVHQIELKMQNEELREKQLALEESREKYLDLYDFAHVGYLTLNEKGLIQDANLTAVRLLGVERQNLTKMFFSQLVSQEFEGAYYSYIRQVLGSNSSQTCEVKLANKDGTHFYAQLETIAVPDENGKHNRCRMILSNITERRNAEKALLEREERYRNILKTMMDGFWLVDTTGRILEVNDSYCNIVGYSHEELLGMNIADLEVVETQEQTAEHFQKIIAEGMDRFETMHRRKDGSTVHMEVSAHLLPSNGGRLFTFLRDITDIKKGEDQLRNAEQRYRRLFEDAPLMYVITRSEEGVPFINDCNDLFLRSLDYARQEVVGKTLANFYSPKSCVDLLDGGGYRRALAGEFVMGERQLLTRSGKLIPTLLYTAPETDSSGLVIGTRAMFVDITEQKKAEEALKESEREFRLLADNTLDVIWQTDLDFRFTSSPEDGSDRHSGWRHSPRLQQRLTGGAGILGNHARR